MPISDNLFKLKKLVEELTYSGDDIEFDAQLASIDLVIYDLRTEAFFCAPVERRSQKLAVDWGDILSDISAGLTTAESESEKTTVDDGTSADSNISTSPPSSPEDEIPF